MEFKAEKKKKTRQQELEELVVLWHKSRTWPEFMINATLSGSMTSWRKFLFWTFLMKNEHSFLYKLAFMACCFGPSALLLAFAGPGARAFVAGIEATSIATALIIAYAMLVYDFHDWIRLAGRRLAARKAMQT